MVGGLAPAADVAIDPRPSQRPDQRRRHPDMVEAAAAIARRPISRRINI